MTETIKRSYVLGVDPGTITGLAMIYFDRDKRPHFMWQDELSWDEAAAKIRRELGQLGYKLQKLPDQMCAVVACEKFTVNTQTGQRGQGPAEDSLGMIGVVRHYSIACGVPQAKMEQASAAKKAVSDPILKTLDLYARGMKHANDAMRHAVLYAIKANWIDKQLLAQALL